MPQVPPYHWVWLHNYMEVSIVCFARMARETVREANPQWVRRGHGDWSPFCHPHCRAQGKCHSNIPLQETHVEEEMGLISCKQPPTPAHILEGKQLSEALCK